MRLYHYKLLPVLPQQMIISQWRECIAIKRQWEKGTLKHRLVSYVMNYDRKYFLAYVYDVVHVMRRRNIRFNTKYVYEIEDFCGAKHTGLLIYPEHNDRYLTQCYFNLQEKYDRGIINQEEWDKIRNANLLENVSVLDLYY